MTAIPGVGLLTATAFVACGAVMLDSIARVGSLPPRLGLVPRQHSSGGKERLLGSEPNAVIAILRRLLIHGARALWQRHRQHPEFPHTWLGRLAGRRPTNVALVALANKRARTVWAMLYHGRAYDPHFKPRGVAPAAA